MNPSDRADAHDPTRGLMVLAWILACTGAAQILLVGMSFLLMEWPHMPYMPEPITILEISSIGAAVLYFLLLVAGIATWSKRNVLPILIGTLGVVPTALLALAVVAYVMEWPILF